MCNKFFLCVSWKFISCIPVAVCTVEISLPVQGFCIMENWPQGGGFSNHVHESSCDAVLIYQIGLSEEKTRHVFEPKCRNTGLSVIRCRCPAVSQTLHRSEFTIGAELRPDHRHLLNFLPMCHDSLFLWSERIVL